MPTRRPFFSLPGAPRTPAGWFGAAVVPHVLLVAVFIVFRIHFEAAPAARTLLIAPVVALTEAAVPAPPPDAARQGTAHPVLAPPQDGRTPVDTGGLRVAAPALPGDTVPGSPAGRAGGRGFALLGGPQFGDGRLWVRPWYFPSGLAEQIVNMDSIVRQRLFALADSIQRHPPLDPGNPADWTFERHGRRYGLDGAGLHIGGITIPAIALALLPMPQGNIDQARANARLNDMRADLLRAVARARAGDDFDRAVRELRQRKDRERQELRDATRLEPPVPPAEQPDDRPRQTP